MAHTAEQMGCDLRQTLNSQTGGVMTDREWATRGSLSMGDWLQVIDLWRIGFRFSLQAISQ
jgi:hypothetical protein